MCDKQLSRTAIERGVTERTFDHVMRRYQRTTVIVGPMTTHVGSITLSVRSSR